MEDILKLQKNLRNIIISNFLEQYVVIYWEVWWGNGREIQDRTEVSPKFHRSKAKQCINMTASLSIRSAAGVFVR